MPKIAAVVLLFNPNEEVFLHLESYRKSVEHLYIVDNTEDASASQQLRDKLLSYPHTSLLHSSGNIGISKAYNLALAEAKKDHCDWLLTMDQDSSFDSEQLLHYLDNFALLEKRDIALVSPLHNPKFLNQTVKASYIKQDAVLSSGNLVHVKRALEAGGYDENLFIDEVDHAFCFSLQQCGYDILQDQTVYLNHSLGTTFSEVGNIKLYAPLRLYYMTRNFFYLRDRYALDFPLFFRKREGYLLKFFMKQLLFGKERRKNISMIKKGYRDYKAHVYGKYCEQ